MGRTAIPPEGVQADKLGHHSPDCCRPDALQFADKCMTAQEREDSDACRAMENLSCVCEETLRVLCEELNRGTRLYEVLESGNTDLAILAQQD